MRPDRARIADLVAELVAIPTHEREELAQELLAARLSAAGLDCRLQEVEPGRPNLIASRGRGGVLLCSHVDVHPPHGHPDPFRCRREDDALVGRGVVDAKGQVAALVAAVEAVPEAPVTVVITCAEETSGKGSEELELPEELRPAGGGIVLEPTGFRVCCVQAGCIDLRVRVRTDPSHAYSPDGVSALDVLDDVVAGLRGCSFLDARHRYLPPPVLRVGVLHAGEHLWRTPGHADAECAVGLLPGMDAKAAEREVEDVLARLVVYGQERGATVEASIVDVCEPIVVPEDLPVVGKLREQSPQALPFGGMPSWTDAGNLLVHHGIPCAVFGAGELTSAHSDREWVRLGDLVRLADILAALLASYG